MAPRARVGAAKARGADLADRAAAAKHDQVGENAAALGALLEPATVLPGVGPSTAARLALRLGTTSPAILDVARLLPVVWLDPRPVAEPAARVGQNVAVTVEVLARQAARGRHGPHKVAAVAGGRPIDLVFFGAHATARGGRFVPGARLVVHGRLGLYDGRLQIAHPTLLEAAGPDAPPLPVYPGIVGVAPARLRRIVLAALTRLPVLAEWIPTGRLAQENWPDWATALRILHREPDPQRRESARRRLAHDELLAIQLDLASRRAAAARSVAAPLQGDGRHRRALLRALPFTPTADQMAAEREIARDLARPRPMRRLLQGEVGSGKTLVAMLAMLVAPEAGRQAVLLAPTELLARQHQATLAAWAAPLGIETVLLTGAEPKARRAQLLVAIAGGRAALVIGTHALMVANVTFADLALVVVDEQHRFGVEQRARMLAKGQGVHLLLMTATPIPRTLLMTLHGDLAVSSLRSRPPGRKPVTTRVLPARRLAEVLAACERALAKGSRIYWVCPLVEDGAEGEAVVQRHAFLAARLGPRVGLAHGRQAARDLAAALRAFATGRTPLLVATTVIEVGVDVPEADVIVIEEAQRFGLAQLHQLRGRVGRGSAGSSCLLVYREPLSDSARARLARLRSTDDGFALADADLALRGPGEVMGLRQSGFPLTRFADLPGDLDLMIAARDHARMLLAHSVGNQVEIVRALHKPAGKS